MADELRLDGRVAVVTGAGRGLGRAYALALAGRGASVVVNDFGGEVNGRSCSTEPAQEVVEEITGAGGRAMANADDVSDADGSSRLVESALSKYGQIDVVVTNAGIAYPQRPFSETTFDSLEQMWRVHVGGTYRVLHAAWPHLVAQGYGRIITTTSSGGLYGQPGSQEYSSAKAAVIGLTLSLAHESEAHGIRVNSIAPAAFTRMLADLDVDEETASVMRQLLRPELVAPTVVWLAHESCEVNGRIYEAGAGRTGRVLIGEGPGYWSDAPSPEDLVAHEQEVQSTDDMIFPADAMAWAGWLIETAGGRAAAK